MLKIKSKLFRFLSIFTLRAKYHNRPLDLKKLVALEGLSVESALDLGSGPNPKNSFGANSVFGVDIRSFDVNPNVKKCVLGVDLIPFSDNSFNAVTAYDVLEHIPRVLNGDNGVVFPFVQVMNDIWRVLRVGGFFYSQTPCFPMKEAFQDPTHVNLMSEDTLRLYFAESAWARIYGFHGSFKLITEGWYYSHYFCVLQKTSDKPVFGLNEPQT